MAPTVHEHSHLPSHDPAHQVVHVALAPPAQQTQMQSTGPAADLAQEGASESRASMDPLEGVDESSDSNFSPGTASSDMSMVIEGYPDGGLFGAAGKFLTAT